MKNQKFRTLAIDVFHPETDEQFLISLGLTPGQPAEKDEYNRPTECDTGNNIEINMILTKSNQIAKPEIYHLFTDDYLFENYIDEIWNEYSDPVFNDWSLFDPHLQSPLTVMRKKVIAFASQFYQVSKKECPNLGIGWGCAMAKAWEYIKENPDAQLMEFTTTKGETIRRVVSLNTRKYYTPNGKGRPCPPDNKLYIDLAAFEAGTNPVRCAKRERIFYIV